MAREFTDHQESKHHRERSLEIERSDSHYHDDDDRDDDDRHHHRDDDDDRDDHDRDDDRDHHRGDDDDHDHHDRDDHDDEPFEIVDPDEKVFGDSIAEWTEEWWTWALQAPAAEDPLTDTTDEFAGVNNDGPVFFVAGEIFVDVSERTVEVPEDTPLLVPVLNFISLSEQSDTDPKAFVNQSVEGWKDAVIKSELFAEIDGVAVENLQSFFVETDLFTPGSPQPGSLLSDAFGVPASEDLDPSKAAGYWLMLEDLDPGAHTLRLRGVSSDFFVNGELVSGIVVDVTLHLIIV